MKKSKLILTRLLPLFLIVFSTHTAYSQDTTSVKCFTVEQQKKILKKFVALDECLDLRKADSVQIAKLDTALTRSYEINLKYLGKINEQHKEIDELDHKRRINKRVMIGSVSVNIVIFALLLLF